MNKQKVESNGTEIEIKTNRKEEKNNNNIKRKIHEHNI